jgi:hypothetical protein
MKRSLHAKQIFQWTIGFTRRATQVVSAALVLLSLSLVDCHQVVVSRSAETTDTKGSQNNAQKSGIEQLDPELMIRLNQEQQVVEPFAWGLWRPSSDKGGVLGIDRQGILRLINFIKTDEGYRLEVPEVAPHANFKRLEMSGSLNLKNFITDREFPFKSHLISAGECRAHFILVWLALNRAMTPVTWLDSLGIRIIVEDRSRVVVNKSIETLYIGVHESYVKDINGDGNLDFVLLANDNNVTIQIWTVDSECNLQPYLFKSADGMENSISGKDAFLKKNVSTGRFDIYTRWFKLRQDAGADYWEINQSLYGCEKGSRLFTKVRETVLRDKVN